MTKLKNLYRYITTKGHLEWDGEKYVAVSDEGYWYSGDVALAGGAPNIETDSWNFYVDSGTEATAPVFESAANNTNPTLEIDTVYHVRWAISETLDNVWNPQELQLEYSYEGGAWLPVNATSTVIQMAASVLVEADNTNDRITGQGTWQTARQQNETTGLTSGSERVQTEYINSVWAFQIIGTAVAHLDEIELRITEQTEPWTAENQALPMITVNKPAPAGSDDNAIMFGANF